MRILPSFELWGYCGEFFPIKARLLFVSSFSRVGGGLCRAVLTRFKERASMKANIIEIEAQQGANDCMTLPQRRLCLPIAGNKLLLVWVGEALQTEIVDQGYLNSSDVLTLEEVEVSEQFVQDAGRYAQLAEFLSPIIERLVVRLQVV